MGTSSCRPPPSPTTSRPPTSACPRSARAPSASELLQQQQHHHHQPRRRDGKREREHCPRAGPQETRGLVGGMRICSVKVPFLVCAREVAHFCANVCQQTTPQVVR